MKCPKCFEPIETTVPKCYKCGYDPMLTPFQQTTKEENEQEYYIYNKAIRKKDFKSNGSWHIASLLVEGGQSQAHAQELIRKANAYAKLVQALKDLLKASGSPLDKNMKLNSAEQLLQQFGELDKKEMEDDKIS